MQIQIKKGQPFQTVADALAVVMYQEDVDRARDLDTRLREVVAPILGKDFYGKKNEICVVQTLGRLKPRRLILAGLGKKSEFEPETVRQVAGTVSKTARRVGAETLLWDAVELHKLSDTPAQIFQAFAEGVILGLYRYDQLKSKGDNDIPKHALKRVDLLSEGDDGLEQIRGALKKGVEVAEAVNEARDLVNAPANQLTPSSMAQAAVRMARKRGIRCRVLSKKQIQRLGMNALLGVGQGSAQEPKFIILEYKGTRSSQRPVVLVGKGITFDSGGISLKPSHSMEKMKHDMAGGAAVIGALDAAARLRLAVHVVGLIPVCENMPSGTATKPGDVLRASNGKTIEIVNTDAEGRLILADALAFAAQYKPKAVVDVATLTGACVIALGSCACGLMGNDEKLIQRIKGAAGRCHERVWELPLWDEYAEAIKSDIADVKNTGNREAGAITGAAFLKKFVGGFPWAHLDIAGTVWEDNEKPYSVKGATGFGVRLLTEFLEDWGK